MLRIDQDGMVLDARVRLRRFGTLERGPMVVVNGIIVHQTGGATAQSTFNSYQKSLFGAHFLVDKDAPSIRRLRSTSAPTTSACCGHAVWRDTAARLRN